MDWGQNTLPTIKKSFYRPKNKSKSLLSQIKVSIGHTDHQEIIMQRK